MASVGGANVGTEACSGVCVGEGRQNKHLRAADVVAGRRRGFARRREAEDVTDARRREGMEGKEKRRREGMEGEDECYSERIETDRERVGAWFPRKGVG